MVYRHRPIKDGWMYDWCMGVTTPDSDMVKRLPNLFSDILGYIKDKKSTGKRGTTSWDFGAERANMWRDPEDLKEELLRKGKGRVRILDITKHNNPRSDYSIFMKYTYNL